MGGAQKTHRGQCLALATVSNEGKPHCIAVGYAKVVARNKIVITDVAMRETIANIKRNPSIALAVWSRNWEEECVGYELKGEAKHFTSGKWKEFVERMPENKELKPKGAILIEIKRIKELS